MDREQNNPHKVDYQTFGNELANPGLHAQNDSTFVEMEQRQRIFEDVII